VKIFFEFLEIKIVKFWLKKGLKKNKKLIYYFYNNIVVNINRYKIIVLISNKNERIIAEFKMDILLHSTWA
jgi:hypothetical protein